jgi:GT2 family glycosyltransferase
MSARLDLTITIVSWNTRDLLRACLASIYRSEGRCAFEVHVVDNASADRSVEMVQAEFPQVQVLVNDENLGFARANNQSWAQCQGRYWMLLNSDAELRPGAFDALVSFMESHPCAGLATARLLSRDGTPQNCAQPKPSIFKTLLEASRLHKLLPASARGRMLLGPYWDYDKAIEVGWTWATALIARREAVVDAGPLSGDFFMYGEDLEWCLRMRKRGWQVWFCPDAEILHHGGQSAARKWDDAERVATKLNGIFKAVEKHRGRRYVRALQAASLAALSAERLVSRLGRCQEDGLTAPLDYYRRVLTGGGD